LLLLCQPNASVQFGYALFGIGNPTLELMDIRVQRRRRALQRHQFRRPALGAAYHLCQARLPRVRIKQFGNGFACLSPALPPVVQLHQKGRSGAIVPLRTVAQVRHAQGDSGQAAQGVFDALQPLDQTVALLWHRLGQFRFPGQLG